MGFEPTTPTLARPRAIGKVALFWSFLSKAGRTYQKHAPITRQFRVSDFLSPRPLPACSRGDDASRRASTSPRSLRDIRRQPIPRHPFCKSQVAAVCRKTVGCDAFNLCPPACCGKALLDAGNGLAIDVQGRDRDQSHAAGLVSGVVSEVWGLGTRLPRVYSWSRSRPSDLKVDAVCPSSRSRGQRRERIASLRLPV